MDKNKVEATPVVDNKNNEIDLSQFTSKGAEQTKASIAKDSQNNLGLKKNKKKRKLLPKLWHKIVFGIGVLILTALLSLGVFTYIVGKELYSEAMHAKDLAFELKFLASSQNIPALPEKITALRESKNKISDQYNRLAIYGKLPVVKNYYQDGSKLLEVADHALTAADKGVNAILPYTDLLGFEGEGSFEGGTTQDRIVLLLETVNEITPQIDEVDQEIKAAVDIFMQIDANRYPEKIKDQEIKSLISETQKTAQMASQTLTDYKPVLAQLSKMAGAEEAQKYLVLFQNDNELRPTGGFLTAYAIINIDKGVVTSEKSDDIYELDQKFRRTTLIPEELGKYLTTEKYWNLRDMNISPDFKTSMETFYEHYITVPGEPDDIDGIIAVDTYVLTKLLEIIGPVNAPGYGTFSAEINSACDCPQVVYALSEIITKPTPYLREDRKGVLGPLMKTILANTYELDKARFPELFQVAIDSLEGRHVQMYFMDEDSQKAAEQIDVAGRLYELSSNFNNWTMGENMDFLAIIDANLAGAKSNLFTEYEVAQTISAPVDGYLEKTVEITYKNSAPADNCNLEAGELCLNSTLNDWIRLYVPAGSELIDIQGISNEAEVYEENGLTVIDGYFSLEPLGLAKIKLTYKVPYTDSENYNLRVWKQAGIDQIPMLIDVTGGEEQFTLNKDLEYSTIF